MGTLTHKAARAAYGTAIDAVLKHVKKDREKGLLELVDLTEKYMGSICHSSDCIESGI